MAGGIGIQAARTPQKTGAGSESVRRPESTERALAEGAAGHKCVHLNGRAGCREGPRPEMGPRLLPERGQVVRTVIHPPFLLAGHRSSE